MGKRLKGHEMRKQTQNGFDTKRKKLKNDELAWRRIRRRQMKRKIASFIEELVAFLFVMLFVAIMWLQYF
jgi:hypothetical protein